MSTPIHPGEVLKEEFLSPLNIDIDSLANDLSIKSEALWSIINGKLNMTECYDSVLSRYFKTSIGYWIRIQQKYDLDINR
jgi:addiction module HigA family antidote